MGGVASCEKVTLMPVFRASDVKRVQDARDRIEDHTVDPALWRQFERPLWARPPSAARPSGSQLN